MFDLQLFAVTIRADIPFGLDLLAVFWKNLVGVELDPVTDLQQAQYLVRSFMCFATSWSVKNVPSSAAAMSW